MHRTGHAPCKRKRLLYGDAAGAVGAVSLRSLRIDCHRERMALFERLDFIAAGLYRHLYVRDGRGSYKS